jgi:asparagine synthase (glutamine-hydrolysing)
MPGLLGLLTIATPRVGSRVEAAKARLLRQGNVAFDLMATSDQTGWLGHARLEGTDRTIINGGPGPSVALHGVLHNEPTLRREFGVEVGSATGDLLAAMYLKEGSRFVERLDGEFVLGLVDPARRTALLATDAMGNYPVYWHAEGQDFVFSSDLSALLCTIPTRNKLNLPAVADFLTIGAVLEDKTFVQGVSLVDAGTVIEFELDTGNVRRHRYVDTASFFATKASDKTRYLDNVMDAFSASIDKAAAKARSLGVSLSGGIDSRAILGALNGRAAGVSTYTLGVAGCADQVIAKQLAAIAGTNHRFFEMDGGYLQDFLPNMAAMVSATDGLYLSHGLTEMLALRFLRETGISVLLRGHGGELAKAHLAWPLHTDARAYAAPDLNDFLPYLARRANYLTPELPLSTLLTPSAAAAAGEGSVASFRRVVAGKGLTPPEACSYLYLEELHRRFTVPSLELFRTCVEVRLPFLDAGFLRVLLGAPAEWRDNTEIHQRITRSGFPELLKVRNSNTGAPIDASPTTERLLGKLNSALRMFNVHGYRHYHNYDEWMRRSLLEAVEQELSGDWARTRGFVDRNTIHTLVEGTRKGTHDRSYVLQALLVIELWMRENHIEAA